MDIQGKQVRKTATFTSAQQAEIWLAEHQKLQNPQNCVIKVLRYPWTQKGLKNQGICWQDDVRQVSGSGLFFHFCLQLQFQAVQQQFYAVIKL
ncbi:hypothetical protein GCM10008938_36020 [Deinococcus roseus]|uniref:Integrase SAM-like N-terminal domain-containing protein n=1 Tax=Deinococcus roseus TaxID=392414 RepID=A0ABQ2D9H1_9DEIO|nr:hypothetical protein GCM10008938_36020 [Deinococcus roseus]